MNVNDGDPHLPIYDNAYGNGDSGSSTNSQPSLPTETNLKSSATPSTSTLSTGALPPLGSHSQSSRKHSYTHSMSNDSNSNQHKPTNSIPTSPNIKDQFFLEQQIKLTQLHQLQQLQNRIFQQQVCASFLFHSSLNYQMTCLGRWHSSAVNQLLFYPDRLHLNSMVSEELEA